jgi:hypothetical protein
MDELDERHFGLTTTQTRYRATMWHKHAAFFVTTTIPIILYGMYLQVQHGQTALEAEVGLKW